MAQAMKAQAMKTTLHPLHDRILVQRIEEETGSSQRHHHPGQRQGEAARG